MANPIKCKKLNDELVQLQADYQSLAGFKWFMFKLTSWSLASALDDFDPADADSVRDLYTVYEGGWFSWVAGLFDIYTAIKDSLFHRLLSHFGGDDALNTMSHPKADELLLFSEQFGGLQDQTILVPLLDHGVLFDFVKDEFEDSEHNLDELKGTIDFKLSQLPVLNTLAAKTGQPVSRFIHATEDQAHLYTVLLEQPFSPEEMLQLVVKIQDLESPQVQINLVTLFQNRPGLFHAHRENIFKSILDKPNMFKTDIEFFTKLDPCFSGKCSDEQCVQIIENNVLRAILNVLVESDQADKATLVNEVMAFPAQQGILDLMHSNQPKAIALLVFSAQFGGIRDKEIIDLLLKHDFLFDFVQRQFTAETPKEMEALKRIINVKLAHLKIWETLAAKTNTPIDGFYKASDLQTALYEALLQQLFAADVDEKLMKEIQSLPSPQRQVRLLELYQSQPVLFHAHRDNVFKAILETPDSVTKETDFVQSLVKTCTEDECKSIIDDRVLRAVVDKVMACPNTNEALLIKQAMVFPNQQGLLDLMTSYPNTDVSHFLLLQEPAMKCIKQLENGDFPDELKMTLESSDKARLFFYLLNIETKGSEMARLVNKILQTDAPKALLEILIQLKVQNRLYQDSVIATFNAFVTISQLEEWRKMAAKSWINQDLIKAICKDSSFAGCIVYLFQLYPDLQPHKDIAFLQDPNQFINLCITLKGILKESDINLIINNSTLRDLLTVLSTKKGLRSGLVEALESHESTFEILQVMKRYPNLDIDQLMKLDRINLNRILEINGLEEADITDLLQPDRFPLFVTLRTLKQSNLDSAILKEMIRIKSDHARSIHVTLNDFNEKNWIKPEYVTDIFLKLAARVDFKLLSRLIKLEVVSTLFDDSIDNLFRLLEMRVKNDLLPVLLECLIEKKALTSANIVEIIEILGDTSPAASNAIMSTLDEMPPSQLTSDNSSSVLKLLICASWNDEVLTHDMVKNLLSIVDRKALLTEIAEHRNAAKIIIAILALKRCVSMNGNALNGNTLTNVLSTIKSKDRLVQIAEHRDPATIINAIAALQTSGILDDEVIGHLVDSENFMTVSFLLQKQGLLNIENIRSLMASPPLVDMIVALHPTRDILVSLIAHHASPDLCKTVFMLQEHNQLSDKNIDSLMTSPDLLRTVLMLQEKNQLSGEIITSMMASPDLLNTVLMLKDNDQLNAKNIASLMASSHLVKTCLMLQQRRQINAPMLGALMLMSPANIPFLIEIIERMDTIHFFRADATVTIGLIYKAVTHHSIENLHQTIALLHGTDCNVVEVYSNIINAQSLDRIKSVIRLLNSNSLSSGTKAVDNFKCLLNQSELFAPEGTFDRLSKSLAKAENKQEAFDNFIKELMNPAKGMFSRFTSFFGGSSSEPAAAAAPKAKTL